MEFLNFSNNLVRLRREKKVTQEELADFIGVTKASVSKWETRQTLPDILLLPRLASYFDVSVDELLGYDPQLSREQIQRLYHELAEDFSQKPFEEVVGRCKELTKRYYSCYPLLFQLCVLYLNHFVLAGTQDRQREILTEASNICGHILEGCRDMGLCGDAVMLRATIDLLLGRAREVIESLEETNNPYRLSGQADSTLIQAYMMAGEAEKAVSYTQISMYLHLMLLISGSTKYLELCAGDIALCEETISRVDKLCEAYHTDRLSANSMALFNLQAAVVYSTHQMERQALDRLEKYIIQVKYLLSEENISKHSDSYFDKVADWYENSDLGSGPPRSKQIILDSAISGLSHPAFESLKENQKYKSLKASLEEVVL